MKQSLSEHLLLVYKEAAEGRGGITVRAAFREHVRREAARIVDQHGVDAMPLLMLELVNEIVQRISADNHDHHLIHVRGEVLTLALSIVEQIRILDLKLDRLRGFFESTP